MGSTSVCSLCRRRRLVGKTESAHLMPSPREVRRISGFIAAKTDQLCLESVPDQRDRRGRRWELPPLLRACLLGLMTGQKSFADVERLTGNTSKVMQQRLGISRRVPDTTLRDALATVEPEHLSPVLHGAIRSAVRSKSLSVDFGLPFGCIAMDGKHLSVPAVDDKYSQLQTQDENKATLKGRIGTMTVVLASSEARPCIEMRPIPAATNEMGAFARTLDGVLKAYGHLDLFRLVSYDAGACSKANADHIRASNLHYLLSLKGSQPGLLEAASLWLSQLPVETADGTDVTGSGLHQVTRTIFLRTASAPPEGWEHLRSVIRVDSDGFDRLGKPTHETYYFLSSLPVDRLTPKQWLTMIRRHWAVENAHQVLDVAFEEDDHPWVTENPRLTVVLMILRRIPYTLLSIFRTVTQRSDERRSEAWKELFRRLYDALLVATAATLAGIRRRPSPTDSPPTIPATIATQGSRPYLPHITALVSGSGDFTRQPEERRTSAKPPWSRRSDQQIRILSRRPGLGRATTDRCCHR